MKKSILLAILLSLSLSSSVAYANEVLANTQVESPQNILIHTNSSLELQKMTNEDEARESLLPYTQREILKNIDVNVNVSNTPNPSANGQGLVKDSTIYSLPKDTTKQVDKNGNEIEDSLHPLSDIKLKVNVNNAPDLSTTIEGIKRNPITGTITIDMTNNPTAEPLEPIKDKVEAENYRLGNMPDAIDPPRDKVLYEVWKNYAPRGAYNNPNALVPLDPAYTDAIKPKVVRQYTAPAPKPVAPTPPVVPTPPPAPVIEKEPEPIVSPETPKEEPKAEVKPEPVVPKEPTQEQKNAVEALLPPDIVPPPPADGPPPVILQSQGDTSSQNTNTTNTNTIIPSAPSAPTTPIQNTSIQNTPSNIAPFPSTTPTPNTSAPTATSIQNINAAQNALNPNAPSLSPPPANQMLTEPSSNEIPDVLIAPPSAAMSPNSPPPATQ